MRILPLGRILAPRAVPVAAQDPVLSSADRTVLTAASRLVALVADDHVPSCRCRVCGARALLSIYR